MAPAIHSLGVHELQVAYATEQLRPTQVIEAVLARIAARGDDAVWISRRPDHELRHRAADLVRWGAGCVQRLVDAGAIVVGKTNLDQFATGLTGPRSPYGIAQSVFGGGLIAGGSSSGSAVALAAGLVGFALGP